MSDYFSNNNKKAINKDSHESADTDESRDSIHHTLGPGATQAAQGNHLHDSRYAKLPTFIDTEWLPLTLSGTWVAFDPDHSQPRYRRLNGIVYLSGLIKSGATPSTITNLPVGFRFTGVSKRLYCSLAGTGMGRIDVFPGGNIDFISGSNTYVSLENIIYPSEV